MSARPEHTPQSLARTTAALRAAGCVFAEDEARLIVAESRTATDVQAMVAQRVAGLPLEHILGWVEFCRLRVIVDRGVFIPRQRTEFLVREAVARTPPGSQVLDLCCGSGAIGVALAHLVGGIDLVAVDIDPAAVRCAARNVTPLGGRVYEGDLFGPVPAAVRGRVTTLVANAPYVPTHEIALLPSEAREHEPTITHDGGADGLDVLRRVAAGAPDWLAPGGHLLVETGDDQADQAGAAFAASGLEPSIARSPELYATVVIGRRP